MDVVSALVANRKSAVLRKPGQRALHNPPVATQLLAAGPCWRRLSEGTGTAKDDASPVSHSLSPRRSVDHFRRNTLPRTQLNKGGANPLRSQTVQPRKEANISPKSGWYSSRPSLPRYQLYECSGYRYLMSDLLAWLRGQRDSHVDSHPATHTGTRSHKKPRHEE